MMRRACGVLGASLWYVACGGTGGDRPTDVPPPGALTTFCNAILPLSTDPDPGSGPVDCHALDAYELSLHPVDSNEVPRWWGDSFETAATSGWYINNDRTGQQTPAPDTDPFPATAIPGGRCIGVAGQESRYAAHILTGVLTDYGGSMGRNMERTALPLPCPYTSPGAGAAGGGCPTRKNYPAAMGPCSVGVTPNTTQGGGCVAGIDASGWDGIVLWARKGQGGQSTIRISVGDFNDDDSNQACQCNNLRPIDPTLPVDQATNKLVSATDQNDTSNGCDKFGLFATLDGAWRPYLFPFSQMQQGGWGKPQAQVLTSNIFSLSLAYGRGAWDIWIDDVSFYRRRK